MFLTRRLLPTWPPARWLTVQTVMVSASLAVALLAWVVGGWPGLGAAAMLLPIAVLLWRGQRLAGNEAFLAQVIDAAPDAICVFDRHGRLTLLNRRARALFPGGSDASFAAMVERAGMTLSASGIELRLADGSCFSLAQSGTADGSLQVIALADVTAARSAERERQHMLEFLSHDMRSPQVAILGLAQDSAGDVPMPERLRRIRQLASRTLELADAFVQLSRLSEVSLEMEQIDLAALVGEVVDRAWFAARDQGIELVREIPDEPVCLRGDGHVLSRAIENLLGNAIRHGPEGSRVVVSVARVGRLARLTVSDQGPGLPEARREAPFQRYGPRRRGDAPGGAGLGLSFVKAAVEQHGGAIACQPGEPRGTVFTIDLDAVPAG